MAAKFRPGDAVRLARAAALDSPAGVRVPLAAGTAFAIDHVDGRHSDTRLTVTCAGGHRYAGLASHFESAPGATP